MDDYFDNEILRARRVTLTEADCPQPAKPMPGEDIISAIAIVAGFIVLIVSVLA